MKKWLKIYFGFSATEIKGLLCLLFLLSLLQLVPFFYRKIIPDDPLSPESEQLFEEFQEAMIKEDVVAETKKNKKEHLFDFDPNTLDAKGWERLGLSSKQAASILKYREKGGRFYRKEDLKKMYTIHPELYIRLLPHISIAAITRKESTVTASGFMEKEIPIRKRTISLALNEADSAGLVQARGIGPVFASRILKYRRLLGGFVRLEQLLDVYGMDSTRLEILRPQLSVDTAVIRKIAINKASAEELRLHPYIGYKLANVLVAYRKQHGIYPNFAGLSKVAILNTVILEKIAPYISYEHD